MICPDSREAPVSSPVSAGAEYREQGADGVVGVPATVGGPPRRHPAPARCRAAQHHPQLVVTCHTLGVPVPEGELWCHDELWVVLHRPAPGRHRVPTWRGSDGRRHADDPVRALLAVLGSG